MPKKSQPARRATNSWLLAWVRALVATGGIEKIGNIDDVIVYAAGNGGDLSPEARMTGRIAYCLGVAAGIEVGRRAHGVTK